MEYESVIAFQRLEKKLDDIDIMVAEMVIKQRDEERKAEKLTKMTR